MNSGWLPAFFVAFARRAGIREQHCTFQPMVLLLWSGEQMVHNLFLPLSVFGAMQSIIEGRELHVDFKNVGRGASNAFQISGGGVPSPRGNLQLSDLVAGRQGRGVNAEGMIQPLPCLRQ